MSGQCKGITKSGTQCKISRNLVGGYCHLHLNQKEITEAKDEIEEEAKEKVAEVLNESSEDIKLQDSQTEQKVFEPKVHLEAVRQDIVNKPEHRFFLTAVFFVLLALIFSFVLKRK